jgi:hypothetical protein
MTQSEEHEAGCDIKHFTIALGKYRNYHMAVHKERRCKFNQVQRMMVKLDMAACRVGVTF